MIPTSADAPQIPSDPLTETQAPTSATPFEYSGHIAEGVTVAFRFNPASGCVECQALGELSRAGNKRSLARYRALRAQFLQRVAALLGERVIVFDLDAQGRPEALHVVDPPAGGRA
jgi:hypothetical protein